MYIRDHIDVELPESLQMSDDNKNKTLNLRDSLENVSFSGKALEVTIDATHCGYFNRNHYFYNKNGMASAVGSFLEPYGKPILVEHKGSRKAIGRATSAAFLPIPAGTFTLDSKDAKFRGRPTGKIRIKALITDEEAIKDLLESRYLTVSIGGKPVSTPVCSVCGDNVEGGFSGPQLSCDCEIGTIDAKKGYTGMVVDQVEYAECSFVNHPADYTSVHAAKAVSMSVIKYDATMEDCIQYDQIEFGENNLFDSLNKEESGMTDEKVKTDEEQKKKDATNNSTDEPKDENVSDKGANNENSKDVEDVKAFETLIKQFEDAYDNCEECKEDVSKLWEDESEDDMKIIMDASAEYDIYLEEDSEKLIPEDKKLTAEARKDLASSDFCGPGRSYPVPDCQHVATAKAFLGDPEKTKNLSASQKAKVVACVNKKESSLKGDSNNKDESILQQIEQKLATLAQEKETADAQIAELTQKLADKTNSLQVSDKRIVELTDELRSKLAEKVIDLSIMTRKNTVNELFATQDKEDFNNKYEDIKGKLIKRTNESLSDTINDLSQEFEVNKISAQVHNSGVDDSDEVNDPFKAMIKKKKDHNGSDNVSQIVFGDKK